jgi:putative aldouronate transport system permease protein
MFGFPAPIVFALLIYELRYTRMKRVFQTISYLPHFVSWVVVYALLYNFFSLSGVLNQLMGLFGKEAIAFLSMPEYFRSLFVGSAVWKEVGWGAIIYLAALTRVDPSLHEAAAIDGAGRHRRLWHITLPAIRPIASIMFVLGMGGILSVSFEQVMVMINPMVASEAEVLDYYIYRVGLLNVNNFSYSAAIGFFRSLIALVFVLLANWVAKKIDEDGGIW